MKPKGCNLTFNSICFLEIPGNVVLWFGHCFIYIIYESDKSNSPPPPCSTQWEVFLWCSTLAKSLRFPALCRISVGSLLIGLSQLRPSICDWPIAPCLRSIMSCSGFTAVFYTRRVTLRTLKHIDFWDTMSGAMLTIASYYVRISNMGRPVFCNRSSTTA